jgi:hypothetical protein
MISTITTTTVDLISTTTTSAMSLISIITLIVLLIQRDFATASADSRARRLNKALTATIVPLFVVFLSVTAVKVVESLR